jgi:DNA polymerase-1
MISVDDWLQNDFDSDGERAKLLMQVHDELVLEVREDQLDKVQAEVEKRMSEAADLEVPLVVDSGSGSNWDEAH